MESPHLLALIPGATRRGNAAGVPRYNRPMTTTSAVPSELAGFDELTATDEARITEAITATYAPTTLHAYAWAWSHWAGWCDGRALDPLPGTPAAVCAYLVERAEQGVTFGTISLSCSAIAYRHRRAGAVDPTDHDTVRQVRRGLRRSLGTAPIRQARPLTVADIRQIVARIDRGTAQGARDTAIILLGFASALRRGELAALTLSDIETKPSGLLLTVRRSKTDPTGAARSLVSPMASTPAPTPSPPSPPGTASEETQPDRCSPACAVDAPTCSPSPVTPSP